MGAVTTAISFALSFHFVSASKVCAPLACLAGSASSQLLAVDVSTSTYFIPGNYSSSDLSPTASLDETISSSSSAVQINPPPYPVTFALADYGGEASLHEKTASVSLWNSAYIPSGWYALIAPGKALWGAIPDASQLPSGDYAIKGFASSTCSPPCSSQGICIPSNSSSTCACAAGWTGALCDFCESGFYGQTCQACESNCTVCDDGLLGTGLCLGTTTTAVSTCNCDHGTCTSPNSCECAAGWISNGTISSALCNTCAEDFFEDSTGNCLSCPLGCATCSLSYDSVSTPSCTACLPTLALSTTIPATCQAVTACPTGEYYESSSSSCESCSAACSSCNGPETTDCLACASPRANLQGECVAYDSSTGVCDSSLSVLDGTFVIDNDKSECESCPAGCLSCYIPGFTSASSYSTLVCSSCQEGYLLQSGSCVATCSSGFFLPPNSADRNGTCSACDTTCSSCSGSASYCTSCSNGYAVDGTCQHSCPSSTIAGNDTCLPCHPDCATCSAPSSADSCLTCLTTRPILSNGYCVPYCPMGEYQSSESECSACDRSCASCLTSGACTSCPDNYILVAGICTSVTCAGPFAVGLGICLSTFLSPSKRSLWPLAFLAIGIAVLATGASVYVRRERRRTRSATALFANSLDEHDVRLRLGRLRLERVLGLDRLRDSDSFHPDAQMKRDLARDAEGKRKLRSLFLHPRTATKFANPSESIRMTDQKRKTVIDTWFAPPPPPYAPSHTESDDELLDTLPPSDNSDIRRQLTPSNPPRRARVLSLGGPPSPPSLDLPQSLGGLNPPPRRFRAPADEGEFGFGAPHSKSDDLYDLWPSLEPKYEHAWI